MLNTCGCVRFPYQGLCAERGLPGEHAGVWLYGGRLTLEYDDEPLSRYKVTYQPDNSHLRWAREPQLYDRSRQSPQPTLWERGNGDRLEAMRMPECSPRKPRRLTVAQGLLSL
jgi:hypothetical protein